MLDKSAGEELPADVIVTATGLAMVVMGEVALSIDGAPDQLAIKPGNRPPLHFP